MNIGRNGWMLDADNWDSVHLVAVDIYGHRVPVTDRVFPDGRHEFVIAGDTFSFQAKNNGWGISLVATPQPVAGPAGPPPGFIPDPAPPPGSYSAPPPGARYYAPPAAGESSCEEADAQSVYDDGKIIELDDGRKLAVADYDTSTSSVWVPPFDGMICGDRYVNKDDNEGVDLEP